MIASGHRHNATCSNTGYCHVADRHVSSVRQRDQAWATPLAEFDCSKLKLLNRSAVQRLGWVHIELTSRTVVKVFATRIDLAQKAMHREPTRGSVRVGQGLNRTIARGVGELQRERGLRLFDSSNRMRFVVPIVREIARGGYASKTRAGRELRHPVSLWQSVARVARDRNICATRVADGALGTTLAHVTVWPWAFCTTSGPDSTDVVDRRHIPKTLVRPHRRCQRNAVPLQCARRSRHRHDEHLPSGTRVDETDNLGIGDRLELAGIELHAGIEPCGAVKRALCRWGFASQRTSDGSKAALATRDSCWWLLLTKHDGGGLGAYEVDGSAGRGVRERVRAGSEVHRDTRQWCRLLLDASNRTCARGERCGGCARCGIAAGGRDVEAHRRRYRRSR